MLVLVLVLLALALVLVLLSSKLLLLSLSKLLLSSLSPFAYYFIGVLQSVATGQASITLEWKNTQCIPLDVCGGVVRRLVCA